MERFYQSQIQRLISTIRSGCDSEIEEVLLFAESMGGPLAAAAAVGLAWVVERRSRGEQQDAEPQVEQQLQLPVAPTESPRPTPDWVKAALARKAG